jgi:oligopeptidase B
VFNAINRLPHLYKGVILRYPFLDVLTSLLDDQQPLSQTDYEEFGNPIKCKQSYKQIESISPYENIRSQEYPLIHIVAGENDYRTPVGQVAKFVKRFRQRSIENGRFETVGLKGITVDVSKTASHLGETSLSD